MRRAKVSRKFPVTGSTDQVILFSWGADPQPLKRNVARVDCHGNVVWRAELPGNARNDCFNSLAQDGDGFVARTYSEWAVYLDADGAARRVVREPLLVRTG